MKIRQLIDYDVMRSYMNSPIEAFEIFGQVWETRDGIYIYRDIGASILGVVHLDSVNQHNHFYVNNFAGDDIVFSTHLDDRLGAYILIDLLPKIGIHVDWLLTEGEEKGKSTAKYFETDKQYKWMFSFDRRGTDAVYYRYNTPDWLNILRKNFSSIAHGSVSDIDYLSHLHCCGLNVGTGYHDEHQIMAYANMSETAKQIGRFQQFYQNNKRIYYPYQNPPPVIYTPPKYVSPSTNTTYTTQNPSPQPPAVTKEEPEEIEDTPFNPYQGMSVDIPLDIEQYIVSGVVVPPDVCAFCMLSLAGNESRIFIGICEYCERWAVCCSACHVYFDRTFEPTQEMEDNEEDLYFGLCPVCTREGATHDEDRRIQKYNQEWGDEQDPDGDSETPAPGIA